MAYQRSKRTQFNPADIRVNRGQSLSQFGSTYAQAAFKQVDEAQNFLDKTPLKYQNQFLIFIKYNLNKCTY